jgi:CPA1 family monovalent cation:H+ antiporter
LPFKRNVLAALTWGGLRGGISIALALSLPASPERDLLVTAAYFVVTFAVLAQGLTFGRLIKRLFPSEVAGFDD